jgi:hypothetical protein
MSEDACTASRIPCYMESENYQVDIDYLVRRKNNERSMDGFRENMKGAQDEHREGISHVTPH